MTALFLFLLALISFLFKLCDFILSTPSQIWKHDIFLSESPSQSSSAHHEAAGVCKMFPSSPTFFENLSVFHASSDRVITWITLVSWRDFTARITPQTFFY